MSRVPSAQPGPGVDAAGEPVIDPTRNVLDLVEAANRRQDDLRQMSERHTRELATIRASHATEMRIAEADRLDAIREVDAQAVQQAATVQDTRATALAGQVADAAEAMRSQVANTATAAATALATALAPIVASIEQLRAAMWQEQGQKTQVVETQAKSANTGLWVGLLIAGVVGFLTMCLVIFSAITLAALLTKGFTQ